ncbi:MAG: hypothetical protein K8I01_08635 [Candidatus Methylomirabilis sp.]|nr:hypothetical protein [Deltaproteobacteria bacterium]
MKDQLAIIEIAPGAVRGCVFNAPGDKAACATEHFTQAGGRRDALSRLVSTLQGGPGGGALKDGLFLSFSPALLSIRVVEVPFEDREKINGILPFELAGCLPSDAEDFVFDNLPLGGGRAIAVGMEKRLLRDCLSELNGLGLDPRWAGPAAFAAPALIETLSKNGGYAALVTPELFSVSEGGRLVFFNAYNGADSLRLNIELLSSGGVTIDRAYSIGLSPGALAPVMADIEILEGKLPEGMEEMAAIYALSLTLRGRRLPGSFLDFRRGELEYTKEKSAARKKLKLTLFLCALLSLLGISDLYMRYLAASGERASYRSALRSAYLGLFPGEGGAADELYQMEVKMKLLDEEARVLGGIKPAEVMRKLATFTPKEAGIVINELYIGEERISAKGEAASFEAANGLKDALSRSSAFREVLLADLKAKPGGGAVFTLSLKEGAE